MIRAEMLLGEWHLAAATSATAELEVVDDKPDPDAVAGWLNGFDGASLAAAQKTSGLVLTITAAGSFTERVTGKPAVQQWFDVEGMLTDEVAPFDGAVVVGTGQEVAWLRPRGVPDFARPVEGRHGSAVLRYDDRDTQIADGLRIVGTNLVRTVNVVTDEQYLDRIVLVYRRAAGVG